jgi:hypothetical protein
MSDHAAVVRLEEVFQHQAGEELMLRELLGTEPVRVRGERPPRGRKRRQNHRPRRLAGECHRHSTQRQWPSV